METLGRRYTVERWPAASSAEQPSPEGEVWAQDDAQAKAKLGRLCRMFLNQDGYRPDDAILMRRLESEMVIEAGSIGELSTKNLGGHISGKETAAEVERRRDE